MRLTGLLSPTTRTSARNMCKLSPQNNPINTYVLLCGVPSHLPGAVVLQTVPGFQTFTAELGFFPPLLLLLAARFKGRRRGFPWSAGADRLAERAVRDGSSDALSVSHALGLLSECSALHANTA